MIEFAGWQLDFHSALQLQKKHPAGAILETTISLTPVPILAEDSRNG